MPFIWGVIVPKQYIPCQNSRTKGTSLECRLASENDFYLLKLLRLSCVLVASTLPKILLLGAVFWGLQNLYAEIWKFFTCVCSGTSIHVYFFKHRQHQCRISVQKAALYWWQKKKHVLAPFGGIPGAISHNFLCKCALWSHTSIPDCIQIRSG